MTTVAQRTHEALDRLEDAIGGRDAIIDAFVAAPPDEDRDRLLGLLADPRNASRGLGAITDELHLTGGEVLALYRSAVTAKAQVLAIHEVAQQLPNVSRDVMRRAQNHYKLCPQCASTGEVWETPRDKKGNVIGEPKKVKCLPCDGTGELLAEASLDHQKLALDMAGMIQKASAPLVQIDASTRSLTIGAVPFAQLQKAVQKVLDPPQLPSPTSAEPLTITTTPIPVPIPLETPP